MTPEVYTEREAVLERLLHNLAPALPEDAFDGVAHYLQHAELEMAFELFCLELITHRTKIERKEASAIHELAVALHLDTDAIFDADFWPKLNNFLSEAVQE